MYADMIADYEQQLKGVQDMLRRYREQWKRAERDRDVGGMGAAMCRIWHYEEIERELMEAIGTMKEYLPKGEKT